MRELPRGESRCGSTPSAARAASRSAPIQSRSAALASARATSVSSAARAAAVPALREPSPRAPPAAGGTARPVSPRGSSWPHCSRQRGGLVSSRERICDRFVEREPGALCACLVELRADNTLETRGVQRPLTLPRPLGTRPVSASIAPQSIPARSASPRPAAAHAAIARPKTMTRRLASSRSISSPSATRCSPSSTLPRPRACSASDAGASPPPTTATRARRASSTFCSSSSCPSFGSPWIASSEARFPAASHSPTLFP